MVEQAVGYSTGSKGDTSGAGRWGGELGFSLRCFTLTFAFCVLHFTFYISSVFLPLLPHKARRHRHFPSASPEQGISAGRQFRQVNVLAQRAAGVGDALQLPAVGIK